MTQDPNANGGYDENRNGEPAIPGNRPWVQNPDLPREVIPEAPRYHRSTWQGMAPEPPQQAPNPWGVPQMHSPENSHFSTGAAIHQQQKPVKEKSQGGKQLLSGVALGAVISTAMFLFIPPQMNSYDGRPDATISVVEGNSVSAPANGDWAPIVSDVADSVVSITTLNDQGQGYGSGVVLSSEGYVLTNNHVVAGSKSIAVTMNDGSIHQGTVVGTDEATDLAVVFLPDVTNLKVATFADSAAVVVGQEVMAMGNPLGLSQTATTGIVSALDRPVTTGVTQDGTAISSSAIQIDAAVNPGNSGGPLFNGAGEVIGITSSIATLSPNNGVGQQSGSIGLGFAIPANQAVDIGKEIMESGVAQHPYLGITMEPGRASLDGVTRAGAVVATIAPGSPAEKAGIQVGDVVVSVDGKTISGPDSMTAIIRKKATDAKVKIVVAREGKGQEIEAELTTRPAP